MTVYPAGEEGALRPETSREGVEFALALDYVREQWHKWLILSVLFFALGAAAYALWASRRPISAAVHVVLTFDEIHRQSYPSGRPFSVGDLTAPPVIEAALTAIGVDPKTEGAERLRSNTVAVPLIPPDVLLRWSKQDRKGQRRERYVPYRFRLSALGSDIEADRLIKYVTALVEAYRTWARREEAIKMSDLYPTVPSDLTGQALLEHYDLLDLPPLLRKISQTLSRSVSLAIDASKDFQDPRINLSFRNLLDDVALWETLRLGELTARLRAMKALPDKEARVQRLRERAFDIEVRLRTHRDMVARLEALIEKLNSRVPVLAGASKTAGAAPLVDAAVLDRLMANDYLAKLVEQATELHEKTRALEVERDRLARDIALIEKMQEAGDGEIDGALRASLDRAAGDLRDIFQSFEATRDAFLDATVVAAIQTEDGPLTARDLPDTLLVTLALVGFSLIIALGLVLVLGLKQGWRTR